MKKMIIAVIFLFSVKAYSEENMSEKIPEIKNDILLEHGLTAETLAFWLSKPKIEQDYNGEKYFDILSSRLYEPIEDEELSGVINKNCIKVEDKTDALGGTYTASLFFVSTNAHCLDNSLPDDFKLRLIVKGLVSGEHEVQNLRIVESSKLGQVSGKRGFPKLAFTEDFFKFTKNNDNYETFISVIHSAKGKPIHGFLQDDKEDVIEVFHAFGTAIGKLHWTFMNKDSLLSKEGNVEEALKMLNESPEALYNYYKTYAHGDLHWSNAFYDKTSKSITLIDNETFAIGLLRNGISLARDFEMVYNQPILGWKSYSDCKNQTCNNIEKGVATFFSAYVDQFPENEKAFLLTFISYFLKKHHDIHISKSSDPANSQLDEKIELVDSEEDEKLAKKILSQNIPYYIDRLLPYTPGR